MSDSEFYTACELEYFSPDYVFDLGDHVVCAVMIDCEDEVPHMYFRKYRYKWEYDFEDIRKPTYIELAYILRGIRDLPNHPKYNDPLINKAHNLIEERLMKLHSQHDK